MDLSYIFWLKELVDWYCVLGYWVDVLFIDILMQQVVVRLDVVVLICFEWKFIYCQFDVLFGQLVQVLKQCGLQFGDIVLVQLFNIVEFYIVFFVLLKIGIMAVNVLYSYQCFELRVYVKQFKLKLLIGDFVYCFFSDVCFFFEF